MKWIIKHSVLTTIAIVVFSILIAVFYYNNNQIYSKKLIEAIKNDDIIAVQKVAKNPFGNENSLPIFSKLLANIAEFGYSTPLQEACLSGNYDIIKLLIEKGAKVNYISTHKDKIPPLVYVAANDSERKVDIIKLLIEKGANVNYKNQGNEAMRCVVESNREDSIYLIEYFESLGLDINERTLLHDACSESSSIVIRYLVDERKFNVNEKDQNGDTPLIRLTYSLTKKIEDLQFLLDNGADKTIKNNEGKTAYDIAEKNKKIEMMELLKP